MRTPHAFVCIRRASPLVLTGGPAAGKSATARALALRRLRAAVVDVDDVRQLVVSGGAAPWDGPEGRRQHQLGVQNTCALGRGFLTHAFEVVVADVLTPQTEPLYRRLLPGVVVVHLLVSRSQARRRAATRAVHLTDDEFEALHDADAAAPPAADHRLDVGALSLEEQVDRVERLWSSAAAR